VSSDGGGAYNDPKLAINRVYTRKGDDGCTSLVGGQRVAKHDARIEAYGTVDELLSTIGVARESVREARSDGVAPLNDVLLRVQHELFNLGSILATLPEDVHPQQPRVSADDVAVLEAEIDRYNESLEPLRSFVLPGGCRLNAALHVARTVCRRAERRCVALAEHATDDPSAAVDEHAVTYLNRLSDALFVWSRWASAQLQADEVLWQPNEGSSGII